MNENEQKQNESNNSMGVLDTILEKKGTFLFYFFVVFLLTYSFLAWIDFLPEPVSDTDVLYSKEAVENKETEKDNFDTEGSNESEDESEEFETGDISVGNEVTVLDNPESNQFLVSEPTITEAELLGLPEKIIFESLNKEVTIANPSSREVAVLDEALLSGVVRHPDSATLKQKGAVFILGHSSYLPLVMNKNFQAFNGIQNLKWGETIKLVSGNKVYVYTVDKVYRATATDTTVPIASDHQRLILATCNSFGSVDDRYVVEADLLEILSLEPDSSEA